MRSLIAAALLVGSIGFGAPAAVAQVVLPGNNNPPPSSTPPQSAQAGGGLITKITPQQVAQLVSGAVSGVTINPQITQAQDGTYLVTFPVWGNQVYSAINVQNCEKDNSGCYVMDFFANFGKQPSIDENWMDAWNNRFFMVRVFKLPNGETVFSGDCMILSGVTPQYVTAFAGFFKKVVDAATTFKP